CGCRGRGGAVPSRGGLRGGPQRQQGRVEVVHGPARESPRELPVPGHQEVGPRVPGVHEADAAGRAGPRPEQEPLDAAMEGPGGHEPNDAHAPEGSCRGHADATALGAVLPRARGRVPVQPPHWRAAAAPEPPARPPRPQRRLPRRASPPRLRRLRHGRPPGRRRFADLRPVREPGGGSPGSAPTQDLGRRSLSGRAHRGPPHAGAQPALSYKDGRWSQGQLERFHGRARGSSWSGDALWSCCQHSGAMQRCDGQRPRRYKGHTSMSQRHYKGRRLCQNMSAGTPDVEEAIRWDRPWVQRFELGGGNAYLFNHITGSHGREPKDEGGCQSFNQTLEPLHASRVPAGA
ncbi:unnamed protein product, partial [Prorocentrum cordatum]